MPRNDPPLYPGDSDTLLGVVRAEEPLDGVYTHSQSHIRLRDPRECNLGRPIFPIRCASGPLTTFPRETVASKVASGRGPRNAVSCLAYGKILDGQGKGGDAGLLYLLPMLLGSVTAGRRTALAGLPSQEDGVFQADGGPALQCMATGLNGPITAATSRLHRLGTSRMRRTAEGREIRM